MNDAAVIAGVGRPLLCAARKFHGAVCCAGQYKVLLQGHEGPVYSVCALDPHTVLSASWDQNIRVWHFNGIAMSHSANDVFTVASQEALKISPMLSLGS